MGDCRGAEERDDLDDRSSAAPESHESLLAESSELSLDLAIPESLSLVRLTSAMTSLPSSSSSS